MTDVPSSRYIIRTIDGLIVAIAGFSDDIPIKGDLDGFTLLDLRALKKLPGVLEVLIPYMFRDGSAITVNLLSPEQSESER